MKSFKIVVTNVFGATTMVLMAYGVFSIIGAGVFGVPELTFLMFCSFVMTSLFGMSLK